MAVVTNRRIIEERTTLQSRMPDYDVHLNVHESQLTVRSHSETLVKVAMVYFAFRQNDFRYTKDIFSNDRTNILVW